MRRTIALLLGLALLMAVPIGAMAQNEVVGEEPVDPLIEEPTEPVDPLIEPYWYDYPQYDGFDYDNGTANGTYVDFLLNEETGQVTDYTTRIVEYDFFYPMLYYDMQTGDEDGAGYADAYEPDSTEFVFDWFDTIQFPNFEANGEPGIFGQSLIFMGQNVLMTFSDYEYPYINLQFGELNDTVIFTLPEGWTVDDSPDYWELYGIEEVDFDETGDGVDYAYADPYYGFEYQWDEAYISNGNISGSIWVDQGTMEIDGNTITITTSPGAWVSASAWVEYDWAMEYDDAWFEEIPIEDDRGILEGAIEEGLMAAVGYLFADDGQYYDDAQTMNDPTFQLEFQNMEEDSFQVIVDSEIETGRIVTLNVNKDALNADSMDQVKVLLDNQDAKAAGSIEELVDMQGGTEAGYFLVPGTNQNTIFVYVPHFSTHIISVGLIDSAALNYLLPGLLAAGFIAAAVGMIYVRAKKNKDTL